MVDISRCHIHLNTIDLNISCNETESDPSRRTGKEEKQLLSCLLSIIDLFRTTPYFRIIEFMSSNRKNDLFTVRRIARNIDMNHKNVIKYLDGLVAAGLIEVVYYRNNMKLYRLTEDGYTLGSKMMGEECSSC
jgi:predicted transcriptional regulator